MFKLPTAVTLQNQSSELAGFERRRGRADVFVCYSTRIPLLGQTELGFGLREFSGSGYPNALPGPAYEVPAHIPDSGHGTCRARNGH